METIKKYSFRDMGVMLGCFMRHILRSRDTMITATIVICMSIAFILLFAYVVGGAIQTLEDIYFAIVGKKEEN